MECAGCHVDVSELKSGYCKSCNKIVKCSACGRDTPNRHSFGRCLVCITKEHEAEDRSDEARAQALKAQPRK